VGFLFGFDCVAQIQVCSALVKPKSPPFLKGDLGSAVRQEFARKRFHGWTLSQESVLLVFVESNAPLQVPSDMEKEAFLLLPPAMGEGWGGGGDFGVW
jgi:hypothetical protein